MNRDLRIFIGTVVLIFIVLMVRYATNVPETVQVTPVSPTGTITAKMTPTTNPTPLSEYKELITPPPPVKETVTKKQEIKVFPKDQVMVDCN